MTEEILGIVIVLLIYFLTLIYVIYYSIRNRRKPGKAPRSLVKFAKINLIVFTIAITIALILSKINFLDYKSPMPYASIEQITFSDFKGIELFKKSLYGSEQFAYIVTTIDLEIHVDSVSVFSSFHPSKSFVYNKFSNSKELLSHELYHFKITEIYARILKKRILDSKTIEKSDIEKLYSQIKDEENIYQTKYDRDTYHSYILGRQKKYEKEIDSLLYLLSAYSKPTIKINLK